MIKGMMVDESMSNLTSASNEASISSTSNNPAQSAAKKKRNLPGNPDPEAEVVALSPRALLATNRFVCEICNKGFQRDQNLQLHRRGHNLPWKLKQRNKNEVIKKKVYVCPEASCVHHDPSRALGDLTGIKKHYSRKHGEKKWKCDKCSKRYAVQSDWKAHSKICGTREYRCDCGTLFSRRDSFITHRAFCDALAEESVRAISAPSNNPLLSSHIALQQPFPVLKQEPPPPPPPSFRPLRAGAAQPELPPWLACPPQPADLSTHLFGLHENPNMSATALLQKAAQMGVTTSSTNNNNNNNNSLVGAASGNVIGPHHQGPVHMSATPPGGFFSEELALASFGLSNKPQPHHANLTSGCMETSIPPPPPRNMIINSASTRDFLTLGAFPHHHHQRDTFLNMAGLDHMAGPSSSSSSYDHQNQNQNQNQPPWLN
ncbi:PREDICTED: protein indeterminate-domain 7-like [Ipomoea nil]|uniref:protein indeterminate-domain 7-like n=1 Tax=Ipomoea nil TaxID=35883 RepID=UPI000901F1DC|nr:PREDICTED: protein indeterminate-domain 7-like [Ipomoea nil]